MKKWIERIKVRLGPLWWYSAVLFVALRFADVVNVVIGLWLVPKHVGADELGAVFPLVQIGGVLGLPLAIVLIPFGKFLNVFAVRGEPGKINSLLRDVFLAAAGLGLVLIVGARFVLPHVFFRLRVAEGMLPWLIVCSGVSAALAPLFVQALQGLKRFRVVTMIGVLSAPVRLAVLLVAMPFRGLSGYFAGQLAADGFSIICALAGLRDILGRKVKSVPYWAHVREIAGYTLPVVVLVVAGRIQSAAEFFVIRHRLPDVESAAYYFITRFAEIPTYLWSSISLVLLPLVSERYETGREDGRMLRQTMAVLLVGGFACAFVLHVSAPFLLRWIPAGPAYQPFASLMGVAAVTSVLRAASGCLVTYELACRRFRCVLFFSAMGVLEAVVLYGAGGIGFFEGWLLPPAAVGWIQSLELMRLPVMVWAIFGFTAAALAVGALPSFSRRGVAV
jgi:O-antigen/teichoic acid export membrane protein